MKNTTDYSTSASYLNIVLKLDANGKLTTNFHNNRKISISS
jgi:hypothetical protein